MMWSIDTFDLLTNYLALRLFTAMTEIICLGNRMKSCNVLARHNLYNLVFRIHQYSEHLFE